MSKEPKETKLKINFEIQYSLFDIRHLSFCIRMLGEN